MTTDPTDLPAPLAIHELVDLLRQAGSSRATAAAIRADIAAGAPVRPDGRIDPFEYAAWLASRTPEALD